MNGSVPKPEEILKKSLDALASEELMPSHACVITPLTTKGANFMSVLYKATISSPRREDLKLFAKMAVFPANFLQQMEDKVILYYKTETMLYSSISPAFEALQNKHRIPVEDQYRFPKFYRSSLEKKQQMIILEDLVSQGYTLYDRHKPIDWPYASKAVEELAKFHALSLAYKREYPEDYSRDFNALEYVQSLRDSYEQTSEMLVSMARNAELIAPDGVKERIRGFLDEHWSKENFLKYYGPSKWGFFIHGDFRASNILFKTENNAVMHTVPIDYQVTHLGSPCMDLLYFVYCGSDAAFRRQHTGPLLDHYYGTFAGFCSRLGLDPHLVFSREEFDNNYKEFLGYGLCTAMSLLPTILAEGDQVPDLEKGGVDAFSKITPTAAFKERFLPILDEFIDLGIL